MKKLLIFISIVLLVFVSCNKEESTSASSDSTAKETITFKISCGVPDSHFESQALREMEKYVEEKTAGGIDIQIFGNNQLGDDKEALELIQQGIIQMVPSGTSVLASFEPSFNILSSPYLFKNMDDVEKALNGEWGDALLATLENAGFKGLGFGILGFTNISNNVRPIVEPEDIENLKLRCVSNPALLDFFKEVGASPVPMSINDVFSALQQGVIDGQYNPMSTIYTSNFHEVQKYISKTSDIISAVAFVVSKPYFESLPTEYQTAIQEGVDIAIEYMKTSMIEEEAAAEQAILDAGKTQINEVSDETKQALFEKGFASIEKYGMESNPELFQELLAILGLN